MYQMNLQIMMKQENTTIIWVKDYGWQFVNVCIFEALINIETIKFYKFIQHNVTNNRN
jgi:hypothetical protein